MKWRSCAARLGVMAAAICLINTEASAHTISIGYHNAGAGAVTFWYGSYHNCVAPLLEGTFTLVGINGTTYGPTTVAFNQSTCTKPAPLIDGTNNFYACSSNPNGFCNSDPGNFGGPVLKWQGVTITGLQAGDYRFTYNPIINPTQDWAPATEGVRSNTFTLTAAAVDPKVGTNKDFVNNTGQSANDFEWLVQGNFASVVSHYDGPFPGNPNSVFGTFTITQVGGNTLFHWANPGAAIANGAKAHLGITVNGSTLHTLSAAWSLNGSFSGCVRQISLGQGYSHLIGKGTVSFENTCNDPPNCPSVGMYVGNLSIEWLASEVALASLNSGGGRSPIRTDVIPGTHLIGAGAELPITIPNAPANARFAMIKVSVSDNPSLTNASVDYIQTPITPNAAISVPGLTSAGAVIVILTLAILGILAVRRKREAERA